MDDYEFPYVSFIKGILWVRKKKKRKKDQRITLLSLLRSPRNLDSIIQNIITTNSSSSFLQTITS